MKHTPIRWGRLIRRALALFLATVTIWIVAITAGLGWTSGLFSVLGADPILVTGVLRSELGGPWAAGPLSGLDGWGRLVLEQSPLLLSSQGAVAGYLSGEGSLSENADGGGEGEAYLEDEDPIELPAVTTAPDDIIAQTLLPSASGNYLYADGVYISNTSGHELDVQALAAASVNITLPQEGPQVLIVHTHACEAYTPDGTDVYLESDTSRTLDTDYNMVRVGREVKAVLEEMGLTVLHDETLHDYPSYNSAYTNSRATVETYLEQYPSIRIVLDLHRDALVAADGTIYKAVTTIDGEPTAQVMLVMGSDNGGNFPLWQENLTLAFQIQKSMDTLYPTLARPITLRSSHYNQYLSTGALLVEVGCHGNTLQEALRGARLFARAAGQVLVDLEE